VLLVAEVDRVTGVEGSSTRDAGWQQASPAFDHRLDRTGVDAEVAAGHRCVLEPEQPGGGPAPWAAK